MTEKQHKTRSILKHDKRPLYCMDNKIKNTLVHTGLCLLHNSEIQRHKHRMVCNTSYMQISFNLQSKNAEFISYQWPRTVQFDLKGKTSELPFLSL